MDRTDEQLVAESLAGDRSAYGELVKRHHGRIKAIAYRGLRDDALADDLAQEVFIRAYRSLHRFQVGRRFGPWLSAIAANRVRDHLKSRARRAEVTWDLDRTSDLSATPLDRAAARQMLHRVEEGVANMPDETQEILRLRFGLGLDYDDVAQTLDIPIGTVKSRISRARSALRKQLGEVL